MINFNFLRFNFLTKGAISYFCFLLSMFFLLIGCFHSTLECLEYGLFSKKEGSKKITKLFVISERCSGSNYINSLILSNLQLTEEKIGQKHFPPWYDLPPIFYKGNSQYYTFEGTEEFLFVIIFRNAYDWVRSLCLQPFHADSSLVRIEFSEFIRKPWKLSQNDKTVIKQSLLNPLVDLNPENGLPFKNALELRNAKISNMLKIMNRAPNVYYLQYEMVRDYPKEVINEIKSLFDIDERPVFQTVDTYKGKGQKSYKPKKYAPISSKDLQWINSFLDPELEEQIGYQLINSHGF